MKCHITNHIAQWQVCCSVYDAFIENLYQGHWWGLLAETTQQACNIEIMSIQCWFNILTLNHHWLDIVSMLCARWVAGLAQKTWHISCFQFCECHHYSQGSFFLSLWICYMTMSWKSVIFTFIQPSPSSVWAPPLASPSQPQHHPPQGKVLENTCSTLHAFWFNIYMIMFRCNFDSPTH